MKKLISLLILSAVFAAPAFGQNDNSSTYSDRDEHHAISPGGLFLEPLIVGTRQDSDIKTSALGPGIANTSGHTDGYGLGLKLGVHVSEVFWLGVDGRYDRLNISDSSYGDASGNAFNYGPTAGLQMPVAGLRLMATYVAGGEYDPESGASGVDLKFRDPTGWRFGAGIHILAVSLNLEYQDLTYGKTDIQSFGSLPVNTATNVDYENRGYMLSLSFPIEL